MSSIQKRVIANVSVDCWKSLKILALQRDTSLQQVVQDVLEKAMCKRSKNNSDSSISSED